MGLRHSGQLTDPSRPGDVRQPTRGWKRKGYKRRKRHATWEGRRSEMEIILGGKSDNGNSHTPQKARNGVSF